MNFRMNGHEIVSEMVKDGKKNIVLREIIALQTDLSKESNKKIQLKNIDSGWSTLGRFEKINKGKRFKFYVESGLIKGVYIIKDKKHSPIEYYIQ